MKKRLIFTVLATLLLAPALALAASVTVTAMKFPTVSPGQQSDGTSTVTVNMADGVPYSITLNAGIHIKGTIRQVRKLVGMEISIIGYYLYKDAGRSQEWGDKDFANTYTAGTAVTGTGTGGNQDYTIWGSVLTSGATTTGTYTDVVTVTVNY